MEQLEKIDVFSTQALDKGDVNGELVTAFQRCSCVPCQ